MATAAAPKSRTGLFIIIAVGLIILGVVVWYFFLRGSGCDPNRNGYDKKGKYDPKCKVDDPKTTNTPAPTGSSGWVSDSSFPIKKGSWGPKVKALQSAIGAKDDGKFGPLTEAALKAKTGKTEVATQAEYDAIVSPQPTGGGTNFEQLKKNLVGNFKTLADGISTDVSGTNKKYRFVFYTNGRFSMAEIGATQYLQKGTYLNGGTEMDVDGGNSYGNLISHPVSTNMKSIVKDYGE